MGAKFPEFMVIAQLTSSYDLRRIICANHRRLSSCFLALHLNDSSSGNVRHVTAYLENIAVVLLFGLHVHRKAVQGGDSGKRLLPCDTGGKKNDSSARQTSSRDDLLPLGESLETFKDIPLRLWEQFAVLGNVGGVHSTSKQEELDGHGPHQDTSCAGSAVSLSKERDRNINPFNDQRCCCSCVIIMVPVCGIRRTFLRIYQFNFNQEEYILRN